MRGLRLLSALVGLAFVVALSYLRDARAPAAVDQSCSSSISSAALEELSGLIRLRGQWCPSACSGSVDPRGNTSTQRRFVVSCRFGEQEQKYRVGLGRDAVEYTVSRD